MKKALKTVSFLVFLVVIFYGVTANRAEKAKTLHARLGGEVLLLSVAGTEALRTQGLSGHRPLLQNEGMLFVFSESGKYSFWMKDMRFPIDIVWLDEAYRILDVKERAEPASYPEIFMSDTPARFVLELPAGFFTEHRLRMGNTLEILP